MKITLVAELLLLGVFVMNLADHEGDSAVSVCEQVRQADNKCCQLLEFPETKNKEQILTDIKIYVESLDLLIKCIQTDKNTVLEACQDLIEDKPRGSKYMTITFDYYKLMQGFNWTEHNMAALLDLRRSTLDKWLEIDKLLD